MKKVFQWGFVIGVVYVIILAVFTIFTLSGGKGEGLGMFIDLLLLPAGFIVGGILEFLFRQIGLIDFFHNPVVLWGLMAVFQGLVLGCVFVGIRKIFYWTKIG